MQAEFRNTRIPPLKVDVRPSWAAQTLLCISTVIVFIHLTELKGVRTTLDLLLLMLKIKKNKKKHKNSTTRINRPPESSTKHKVKTSNKWRLDCFFSLSVSVSHVLLIYNHKRKQVRCHRRREGGGGDFSRLWKTVHLFFSTRTFHAKVGTSPSITHLHAPSNPDSADKRYQADQSARSAAAWPQTSERVGGRLKHDINLRVTKAQDVFCLVFIVFIGLQDASGSLSVFSHLSRCENHPAGTRNSLRCGDLSHRVSLPGDAFKDSRYEYSMCIN